ncbi:MAG TPA: HAMP domain-containing sensor histidine kinase [Solirubrobacteraceae bacterium]|nr:HAMP domain-containing sensor histidine kinase [Solirubrobacteraceae bacterium]
MLLAAVAVTLAVALASVVTYVSVRAQLRDSVDDGLRSLAARVNTAPLPPGDEPAPRRQNIDEQRRRSFLLLLPSSPLGQQDGYAQVVSSAGRIQPPQGQPARLAAGPQVIAVAQGRAEPFFYDSELSGTQVRVYVARFADGQALQAARSLEEVNGTMRRLAAVLAVVSLAGVGLAALLGGFVGRSALQPVRRLMRGTRYVAATQDLSRRVEAIGDDELAGLARSFNAMLEALAESRRAQRQLIADASHELRTPLTTVQANVELLARAGELPPAERDQLREDLLSQLRELTALVGDLVELAREQPPEADLEELDLDRLVAACVERVRSRSPRVELQCALAPCRVKGDRARLERAVMNLLDNARKWSPAGSSVYITVADGAIVVRDEGPGIDPTDLPYVFDRFYRSADARRLPGSGLGLAIVRQVAEMHGGAVWATAPQHGPGAELHLQLPALPAMDGQLTSATSTTGPTSS